MVEAYGSNMRLKELATITAPEARMLMVQPFDQSTMKAVEKGSKPQAWDSILLRRVASFASCCRI